MTAPAIAFDGVTLERRTQEEFSYDLKRLIFSTVKGGLRKMRRRRVLQNVSFTVERGEKIGIIGGNGSGKSTILKVICGILTPTQGRVSVQGRIAPLIELGAGFDPELSVTDNIVYYGNLLGFSRAEMRQRSARILDFAELREYGAVPLKALSSGMNARLGFAIATDVRPEILILDEVLAVGDEAFRVKSTERIGQFWDEHSTIIVVSHDLGFIAEQCQRALWIEQGAVCAIGAAREVVPLYLAHVASQQAPASVVSALPFAGHIDEIHVVDRLLFVRGWQLAGGDAALARRVAVFCNDHYVGDATYGELRADVAARYASEHARDCGFRGSFVLPESVMAADDTVECRLYDAQDRVLHRLFDRVRPEEPAVERMPATPEPTGRR